MSFVELMTALAPYKIFFVAIADLAAIAIAVILSIQLYRRMRKMYQDAHAVENKSALKSKDFSHSTADERVKAVKQIITPDGFDPVPNNYLLINEGGIETYARTFTISALPQKTAYNKTFAPLLNFPSCISSIDIEPITAKEMSRKFDKQLNVLETEHYAAKNNANRQRKLELQYRDTERWAEKVEDGDEQFFEVGFAFTLFAPSIETLNRESDKFRLAAQSKDVKITNLFAVQAEGFLKTMPFNGELSSESKFIKSDGIKKHRLDRQSLSTVFNYTDSFYTHRNGIPLGKDMFTNQMFCLDIYDPSHDGFLVVLAGKTGSGKSATIKMMVERYVPQGYRFVSIDSQQRKGTSAGEYALLAQIVGGVNFQIAANSENILNIFDVQESRVYKSITFDSGYETRTLELSDKIVQATNDILTLMNMELNDDAIKIYRDSIIKDTIAEMYADFGIENGNPDSLYEMGTIVENGQLTSGLVPKKLPTLSDFYKRILWGAKTNRDPDLVTPYKLIIKALKDYVRELYYAEESCRFFTKEEFETMQEDDSRNGRRIIINSETDEFEDVIAVKGIRPYFDGQSTINLSKDCTFTNIDISLLPDSERNIARQIALGVVNEQFIKKNSESIRDADKLVVIVDEAHESFALPFARESYANSARTARKRNVSLIFSTQTIAEFDRYPETQDILKQAAIKMVCKQEPQDKPILMKNLDITDAQADLITRHIGCADNADEETKNKHRGEMCIIDNSNVVFVKVFYLKKTEALSVETTASELEQLIKVS